MDLSRDAQTPMTRLASTPALTAPWVTAAESIARFARAMRPLPSIFRTPMVAHELSSRMPAPARLQSLVAALRGRLAVVNLARGTRLPAGLLTGIGGLVRLGCNASAIEAIEAIDGGGAFALDPFGSRHSPPTHGTDARALHERRMVRALVAALPPATRDKFVDATTWVALALYESASPTIRLAPAGPAGSGTGSPVPMASAEIDYRLVIIVGSGTLCERSDWDRLDAASTVAPAIPWPSPRRSKGVADRSRGPDERRAWFSIPLLVPDRWFAAHADVETLAAWARLTGRAGGPDRYWFPETWDRFLEPGRRVGWLTVADVWRPRPGRLPSGSGPRADDEVTDEPEPAFVRRPPPALTPDLERGVGLPPGYALVQCVGRLSVAVVACPES